MGKIIDLTGQVFGRLKVIERAENYVKPCGAVIVRWVCQCECGNKNKVIVQASHLRSGHTQSCGCLQKVIVSDANQTHGKRGEPLYAIWIAMKKRCYNTNNVDYADYGGRGINVCPEWREDFQSFYDWAMSSGYCEGLTIERNDVNGDYEPQNCRWATRKEQANNKRNNRYITYNGKTLTEAQWADELDMNYYTLWSRLHKSHWSIDKAFNTPVT